MVSCKDTDWNFVKLQVQVAKFRIYLNINKFLIKHAGVLTVYG